MKLVNVETKEQLKDLVKSWAMTWEGLNENDFEEAMEICCKDGKEGIGYLIKGGVMNAICQLTGDNAYPKDLNIFAIKKYRGLAMNYGARWMYDIYMNNARRQNKYPLGDID